ncbi:hypothetical protein [Persephonella sp.]
MKLVEEIAFLKVYSVIKQSKYYSDIRNSLLNSIKDKEKEKIYASDLVKEIRAIISSKRDSYPKEYYSMLSVPLDLEVIKLFFKKVYNKYWLKKFNPDFLKEFDYSDKKLLELLDFEEDHIGELLYVEEFGLTYFYNTFYYESLFFDATGKNIVIIDKNMKSKLENITSEKIKIKKDNFSSSFMVVHIKEDNKEGYQLNEFVVEIDNTFFTKAEEGKYFIKIFPFLYLKDKDHIKFIDEFCFFNASANEKEESLVSILEQFRKDIDMWIYPDADEHDINYLAYVYDQLGYENNKDKYEKAKTILEEMVKNIEIFLRAIGTSTEDLINMKILTNIGSVHQSV